MHPYIVFIFLKKKYISYTGFAFHNKNSHIDYIVKYLKIQEVLINKFKKNQQIVLEFFDIRNVFFLARYQNKKV